MSCSINRLHVAFSNLEKHETRKIFLTLVLTFCLFYFIQIPFYTTSSDTLTYAIRSSQDLPLLKYGFLDERHLSLHGRKPFQNYHVGHTLLLWAVYHIMPAGLSKTIWPAGLVSAISGGLIVGLTFLIWFRLGLEKKQALCIAGIAGILPTIWYHSLIGEVYSLQFLFILLFLYFYLCDHLILSALGLLIANLVSPTSAFCITFILLDPSPKKWLIMGAIISSLSLTVYIFLHSSLAIDISQRIWFIIPSIPELSYRLFFKVYKFSSYFVLNIIFLVVYLIRGSRLAFKERRSLLFLLFLSLIPQIHWVLKHVVSEYGAFQYPIFWALSFPIGLGISSKNTSLRGLLISLLGVVLTFLSLVYIPTVRHGEGYDEAGKWLRSNVQEELKIVGPWRATVGIVMARYDWDFEKVSDKSLMGGLQTEELIRSDENSLVLVCPKDLTVRKVLGTIRFLKIKQRICDPVETIRIGAVKKLYENNAVRLYRWDL